MSNPDDEELNQLLKHDFKKVLGKRINKKGDNVLHLLVKKCNVEKLKRLLDVDKLDRTQARHIRKCLTKSNHIGETPLSIVDKNGDNEKWEFLLQLVGVKIKT